MAAINGPQGVNIIHGAQALGGPASSRNLRGAQPTGRPAADQLDISPAAAQAADAAEAVAGDAVAGEDEVRTELVAQLKAQIAEGSYETVDKVAGAVDRLLDEIG